MANVAINRKTLAILEQAVQASTGEQVETLRQSSLEELRRRAEKRHKRPLKFMSHFPFIGRGNVLRGNLISHEEIEAELDRLLR